MVERWRAEYESFSMGEEGAISPIHAPGEIENSQQVGTEMRKDQEGLHIELIRDKTGARTL